MKTKSVTQQQMCKHVHTDLFTPRWNELDSCPSRLIVHANCSVNCHLVVSDLLISVDRCFPGGRADGR